MVAYVRRHWFGVLLWGYAVAFVAVFVWMQATGPCEPRFQDDPRCGEGLTVVEFESVVDGP